MIRKDESERPEGRKAGWSGPRPRQFKYFLAFNLALVGVVWLVRPIWLEWAIALALVLTIVEVVVIALAQG